MKPPWDCGGQGNKTFLYHYLIPHMQICIKVRTYRILIFINRYTDIITTIQVALILSMLFHKNVSLMIICMIIYVIWWSSVYIVG